MPYSLKRTKKYSLTYLVKGQYFYKYYNDIKLLSERVREVIRLRGGRLRFHDRERDVRIHFNDILNCKGYVKQMVDAGYIGVNIWGKSLRP